MRPGKARAGMQAIWKAASRRELLHGRTVSCVQPKFGQSESREELRRGAVRYINGAKQRSVT